jgi:hypothetical protein
VSRRSGVVSDDAVASEVGEAYLLDGGSAMGAAAAGFFAAAGQRPGVLLAPLTVLIAGVGLGARVLDGRLRQPGLGGKRPRGFLSDNRIPAAAHVAAPGSVAAVLVALAYEDDPHLGRVLARGIALAQQAGASERAAVLKRIQAVGARALSEGGIGRALLAVGGPPEGGTLTAEDLAAMPPVDREAKERLAAGRHVVEPEWAEEPNAVSGCAWHGICVMDARGFAVAAAYGEVVDGIAVDELELRLPRAAVPVRRGVPRVAPGTPIATPAPVGIHVASGDPLEVRYAGQPSTTSDAGGQPHFGLRRDPRTRRVEPFRGVGP